MTTHHTKLTKDDLKKDAMTAELQKGFVWTTKHVNGVLIFMVAFILVGAGYSAYSYFDTKKEEESQELYYQAEKTYLDQKQKFDLFESEANKPAAVAKKGKGDKTESQDSNQPKGEKPSGDLTKDYGKAIAELETVVNKDPSSNSAMMAALALSEIYNKHHQLEKSVSALEKIKVSSHLLSMMVLDRKASTKADLGDCKAAIGIWDQALALKNIKFMAADIKLKKGLCFESMNDLANAKAMYNQAKEGESTTAKTAEKYLQLLSRLEANSATK